MTHSLKILSYDRKTRFRFWLICIDRIHPQQFPYITSNITLCVTRFRLASSSEAQESVIKEDFFWAICYAVIEVVVVGEHHPSSAAKISQQVEESLKPPSPTKINITLRIEREATYTTSTIPWFFPFPWSYDYGPQVHQCSRHFSLDLERWKRIVLHARC